MCFFYCFLDSLFARFWQSFWGPFSQIFQILHEKKCAEIEARKIMTFGGLLGGAGGGGWSLSNSSDSAKHGEKLHSRPAPPAGVRRILRLRPCRRPLWQLRVSWLLAWRLSNILIGLDIAGLLGFCCSVVALLVLSVGMCAGLLVSGG